MDLYQNQLYIEDVSYVGALALPWKTIQNKSIVVSGATGLIASFLIDVILRKNIDDNLNCRVYALCRDIEFGAKRFGKYIDDSRFSLISHDVNAPFSLDEINQIDSVFHFASNTHPVQYSTDPIGTILTNIVGLKNMADFAVKNHARRFVFTSSTEIYGENRGDVEFFDENYTGFLNSNSLRACYTESKRCAEALCQAYKSQLGLDFVISRLPRVYGPSMRETDSKAVAQFIKNGVSKQNVVLKSSGTQFYSYMYVSDAVSAIFTLLFNGQNGEAYNVAESHNDATLKDLAQFIATLNRQKVVFEQPDSIESSGYSRVTKARLSGNKLQELGWRPRYDIKSGIERTILILKDIWNR